MRYLTLLLLLLTPPLYADSRLPVGDFAANGIGDWEEKSFVGNTLYQVERDPQGKGWVKATSSGAASALFREIDVELLKTPFLNWRWRVDSTFSGNDERQKSGDDYPARIYVVFKLGSFFWNTRAINYVWSSNQPTGTTWHNAFTDKAIMVAVKSGDQQLGRWVTEKRNIVEDIKALFDGELPENLEGVAIMSDSDNTGASASASYADIYFSDN